MVELDNEIQLKFFIKRSKMLQEAILNMGVDKDNLEVRLRELKEVRLRAEQQLEQVKAGIIRSRAAIEEERQAKLGIKRSGDENVKSVETKVDAGTTN